MTTKLPAIGFQERLHLFCGAGIALLSLSGRSANPFGVLIGGLLICGVIWYYQRLRIWARREGYQLVSMSGVMFGRSHHCVPRGAPFYRVVLRDSNGGTVQAFVAFAFLDFTCKTPILLEFDGTTIVKPRLGAFARGPEFIFFGLLNVATVYFIISGLSSWDQIETRVLVRAVAMTDEFIESHDFQLIPRVNYRTNVSYANLAFTLPSHFPGKTFLVKAKLEIPGRGGSRKIVHKGDSVRLWVNVSEPDKSFSVANTGNDPEGTMHSTSGKDRVVGGLIGFLLTGGVLFYYWSKRTA